MNDNQLNSTNKLALDLDLDLDSDIDLNFK